MHHKTIVQTSKTCPAGSSVIHIRCGRSGRLCGSADLLCGCAPGNGIRRLMESQQEGIPFSCHLIAVVLPQLGSDHMVMHIYGPVHHLPILSRSELGAGHKWVQVISRCRLRYGCSLDWMQVTIECRSEFGAGQNCVQVRLGQITIGCRSQLDAGCNWAQASLSADQNWVTAEFGPPIRREEGAMIKDRQTNQPYRLTDPTDWQAVG